MTGEELKTAKQWLKGFVLAWAQRVARNTSARQMYVAAIRVRGDTGKRAVQRL